MCRLRGNEPFAGHDFTRTNFSAESRLWPQKCASGIASNQPANTHQTPKRVHSHFASVYASNRVGFGSFDSSGIPRAFPAEFSQGGGTAMGIVCMSGKDGEMIQSVGQMVGKFTGELYPKLAMWEKQLMQSPESLESIEHEVKAAFLHWAGMITSGLIAVVLLSKDLEHKSKRTRRGFDYPLARGRNRDIRVRLLGGF